MNAQQRKYLVDKIKERTNKLIENLRSSIPEAISLNVYMLHKVLAKDFEIKSSEELKEVIFQKAMKAGQEKQIMEGWLGNAWGTSNKKNVAFELDEFFVIPDEYLKMREENRNIREEKWKQIRELQLQLETLEIRIMLASDKTLQKIINEVDDMGDIKLIDTKIKLIE